MSTFGSSISGIGGITPYFPSELSPVIKYTIYTLLLGIIIIITLLVIDYFVPFLPGNPISGPSVLARSGRTFWRSAGAGENLIVPQTDSPILLPASWSASFNFTINDSRQTPGKYRHILHRGLNPLAISASIPGPSGHAGLQPSDIPSSAESTYKENGLPGLMCPGVFLDPFRNDIHIFIHTQSTGSQTLLLESATLVDVPLNQPMSMGLICNGEVLEIYINCKLYDTLLLKGRPYVPPTAGTWFGRYGVYPIRGTVGPLTLWNAPLGSSDYIQVCQTPSTNVPEISMSCPTATPTQMTA